MKVHLLYAEKEWVDVKPYFDSKSIIQDLGLRILYMMSGRKVLTEEKVVKAIDAPDNFIEETMKKVMMVPLSTEEEILYRQDILKDCLDEPDFMIRLYALSDEILKDWNALGRRNKDKMVSRDSMRTLLMDIQVLQLFVRGLGRMKELGAEYRDKLQSKGLLTFLDGLQEEFSDKVQEDLQRIIQDMSFFLEDEEDGNVKELVKRPRIVLECNVGDGLKLDNFRLDKMQSISKKYVNPNSTIGKVQSYLQSRTPDAIMLPAESPLREDAAKLEYEVIQYVMNYCRTFMSRFQSFFDQLHVQTAFYRGALNLMDHMKRFDLETCFPKVTKQGDLCFENLKEVVMCMEQRIPPVGNTCNMQDVMLLIITGANQGGKSTFLRSIGIAQVMMQCGLMVTAQSFESGIFPSLFTHFTRREDSAMNSGRLDEELGRMSQIIDNLGDNSMILLNESFATTTEKEGSLIAYDIVKALTEAGVKVLMVTHLLSFAQRMYDETKQGEEIEFFSAERLPNGKRTFKMIQHAPELTSFGLDLYDKMIKS